MAENFSRVSKVLHAEMGGTEPLAAGCLSLRLLLRLSLRVVLRLKFSYLFSVESSPDAGETSSLRGSLSIVVEVAVAPAFTSARVAFP